MAWLSLWTEISMLGESSETSDVDFDSDLVDTTIFGRGNFPSSEALAKPLAMAEAIVPHPRNPTDRVSVEELSSSLSFDEDNTGSDDDRLWSAPPWIFVLWKEQTGSAIKNRRHDDISSATT
mmetsp:Transcript_38560/g.44016  ORF Transcript_38560/g.44016 Transcript_38560/m.44016 type:complete len:122 (+) Transcript_38560:270-635(+)